MVGLGGIPHPLAVLPRAFLCLTASTPLASSWLLLSHSLSPPIPLTQVPCVSTCPYHFLQDPPVYSYFRLLGRESDWHLSQARAHHPAFFHSGQVCPQAVGWTVDGVLQHRGSDVPEKGLIRTHGRGFHLLQEIQSWLSSSLLWSLESYLLLLALWDKKYLSSEKYWETSFVESSSLVY